MHDHETKRRNPRRRESGAVLLTVLLVMVALLGLGVMGLWLTSGNMQVGANSSMRSLALYVAEAGIERVRADMNGPVEPPLTTLIQGSTPCASGQIDNCDQRPTDVDSNGRPNGVGTIYVDSAGNKLVGQVWPPDSRRSSSGTLATMGTYTVWVRNDTAELRRGHYNADGGNKTVVIRSLGVAPDGKTTVILEVTMGPGSTPGGTPTPPGGVAPVLCNSGKNACDENSSVQSGIVAQ